MHYQETPQEKEIRARDQANLDEDRKEKKKDFDRWQEKFAVDFAKGMDCIYQLISQVIITDLDRTLEQLTPVTRDAEVQFFTIFRRLEDKWGPTSKKDAVEIVRLIHALQGDFRGWDIYLVGLDSLVETLTKTPVRDAANNPMFIPVPNRPHLPRPHPNSTLAEYRAHFAADAAAQLVWEQQHPADKIMNHRPTDEAIKEIVIIALAESQFVSYSTLAQRYQQTDHATRTWPELRRDVESLTQNNARGTSRDPSSLPRPISLNNSSAYQSNQYPRRHHDRHFDQRSARGNPPAYNHFDPQFAQAPFNYHTTYPHQPPHSSPHGSLGFPTSDIRAVSQQTPKPPTATTKFPCANCGADHRSAACDSTLCSICQGTFPTAAIRHAHYESVHRKDTPNKRTRFADQPSNRNHYTPPTSPFLQSRSARSSDGYASHSSYDSGNDSTYSTASGPGMPPTSDSTHHDAADSHLQQVLYDCRVVSYPTSNPTPTEPTDQPDTQPHTTEILPPQGNPNPTHPGQTDITYYLDDIIAYHRTSPYLHQATDNRIERLLRNQANLHAPTHLLYRNGHPPTLLHGPPAADSDSDDLPDLVDISDDERNRLDREGPTPRNPFPPPGTYDIRVATNSSDDHQTDSDDDADNAPRDPATWHDPTLPNLPFHDRNMMLPWHTPPFLSQIEIHQWYRSQMRWRPFIQTLPERHQEAYYRRPAPDLRLNEPNRPFMLAQPTAHSGQSIDPMDIRARLQHFDSQVPQLTWSNYLRTLHPPLARHYRSFPPLHGDSIANQHHHFTPAWPAPIPQPTQPPPPQPQPHVDTPTNTAAPQTSLKDPAVPHPNDTRTPSTRTNYNPPLSHPHIAGRWHYGSSSYTSRPSNPPPSPPAQKGTRPPDYNTKRRAISPPVQKGIHSEGYHTDHETSRPPGQKGTRPDERPATAENTAPINRTRSNTPHAILPIRSSHQAAQERRDSNIRPTTRHTPKPERSRHHSSPPTSPPDLQNDSDSDHPHPTPPQPKRHRSNYCHPTSEPGPPRPTELPDIDQPGNPWCNCCTSILGDDDPPEPAICDTQNPGIRYRIRQPHHNPSHSTLHLEQLRIFSDNYQHHEVQRHDRERILVLPHQLPRYEPSTSFSNTVEYSQMLSFLGSSQYQRYRSRGGQERAGIHVNDHRHNSPNHWNMRIGHPYRTWFHTNVSRTHYSLGEADETYRSWLNHPDYGANQNAPINPYLPSQRNRDTGTPPTATSPQSVSTSSPPSSPHNNSRPANRQFDARTQTHEVHISPDDPNAVIDSGAMMTTVPRRLLLGTPWADNIRPAPPGTTIRYGNMETEPVEEIAHIGSYNTSLVPDRFSTALVCVHDIVSAGHSVTFTDLHTIISDTNSAYTVTIPRQPSSREWRVPLHILEQLTNLRSAHPLRNVRPHHPGTGPN